MFSFRLIPFLSKRAMGWSKNPSPSGGGLGWGWSLGVPTLLAVLALTVAFSGGEVSANGAVRLVVIDEVAGPYLLRVGVLPGDPTLGPLHLSILIQDATGEAAVEDAAVSVAATGPGSASLTEAVNSPQSPQLYEGNLYLDALGEWSLTLDIDSALGPAEHTFAVRARAEGGFNLMFIIVPFVIVLIIGSLVMSQLQRRRRLSRLR